MSSETAVRNAIVGLVCSAFLGVFGFLGAELIDSHALRSELKTEIRALTSKLDTVSKAWGRTAAMIDDKVDHESQMRSTIITTFLKQVEREREVRRKADQRIKDELHTLRQMVHEWTKSCRQQ